MAMLVGDGGDAVSYGFVKERNWFISDWSC